MLTRYAIMLFGLCAALPGFAVAAGTSDFTIVDVGSARKADVAQLKPGTIDFSDHTGSGAVDSETALVPFDEWASKNPIEKKYLALFPTYSEPSIGKALIGNAVSTVAANGNAVPASNNATDKITEKLSMYLAQARFVLDRAPSTLDLSNEVTVAFLDKIDPAIKHKQIGAADVVPFNDEAGTGNDNPDRKWCADRNTSICIQSTYKLEGKIPMGIMLVNKLRDSVKKVADHIDFQSELSSLPAGDLDQTGLQELTTLNTPITGLLQQDIFYVNQILKFGKLFAVFQDHPTDAGKTVVTAFMALAIKSRVLAEKRGFENMPVLRNLVPGQVLMGQSSFNAGSSISAGLPKYARNEIKTIAGLLASNAGK